MPRSIPTDDRISSLPDPILHHILSFLPTKIAATTSILSKRWNPLWLSVPTLHFDDAPFEDFISFRHFVSSVFLLREITLPIRSFHLNCWRSDPYDINRFVYAAVKRGGIEKLDLKIYNGISLTVKLPDIIFNCKTLVVLQLKGVKVNDVIVDLPRLKNLHLSRVSFQSLEYLTKFLSRCLILEELHLKRLLIDSEELVLEENFQYLPNLIRANITNGLRFRVGLDVLLFTLCCKAEVLYAQLDMKYLNTRYHQYPMCHNLIYMELILENNHSKKSNWLLEVLNHCPKLQNLTIHEYFWFGNESLDNLDNWTDPTIVPECLSTQLRTCLLKGYRNSECEIQFAKYIMQNSKVLNTMSIKSDTYLDLNVKHQMITKLTSSRRVSPTCELLFV